MPAVPAIIGVVGAVGAAKVAGDAQKKAAQIAAGGSGSSGAPTVNIADLQRQAQQVAAENAARSAALERQYNPGAQELREGSLESLLGGLGRSEEQQALARMIMAQAGDPLAAQQYDSALTRQAVQAAADDLALGGEVPQDVRNMVARRSLATAGTVAPGSGLRLGRDIVARDLGLTSLDLRNSRLRNAAALGAQEADLERGNAGLRMSADQFGRNNLFDSASFLTSLDNGDFQRALSAAALGQNIAAPASGLDPGSIANLAVGNSNAVNQANQNAAAIAAQSGSNKAALIGQLGGIASSYFANRQPTTPTYSYTLPTTTVANGTYGVPMVAGWSPTK
jgi:hypothetical protein